MNLRQQAELCADLALLIGHGMPPADAASVVAEERDEGCERRVATMLAAGESLERALGAVGFAPWACAVVAAAEGTANPALGLGLVAHQLGQEAAWRERMARVTSYPILVVGSSLFVGAVLFRTVLPTIAVLTEELGGALPLASRVALSLGRWAAHPVAWLVAGAALAGSLWLAADQERLRSVAARLPGLSSAARSAEAWRYFGVLTALTGASVPLDRALEVAAPTVAHPPWRDAATEVARKVRAGYLPSDAFRSVRWLPGRTTRILRVAEASASMPQAFSALTDHAQASLTRSLDAFARWVPVGLLALAALVLSFLAQALFLPALQIDLPP